MTWAKTDCAEAVEAESKLRIRAFASEGMIAERIETNVISMVATVRYAVAKEGESVNAGIVSNAQQHVLKATRT